MINIARQFSPHVCACSLGKASTLVAGLMLLTACGGASNKSPATTPKNGSDSPPITSSNVVDVVRSATGAIMQAHAVFSFAGDQGDELLTQSAGSGGASGSVIGFAWTQWRELTGRADVYATVQAASDKALVNLPSQNCADGGTLAITLSDLDNNGLASNGDSATFVFTNCAARGATANGAMTMSNVVITGTPAATPASPWRFSAGLLFANVALMDERGAIMVNGTAAVDWQRADAATTSGTISLAGLEIQEQGVATEFAAATLSPVDSDLALTSTLSMSGNLNVAGVGAMSVATSKSMLMIKNSGHPASGDVTIQLSRSIVSVFTRDSVTVDIDLDGNGDGTRESSLRTSWQKIHNVRPDIQI